METMKAFGELRDKARLCSAQHRPVSRSGVSAVFL